MTIEEAGQVLLENLPIHVCQTCKGQGWVNKTAVEVGDSVSFTEDGKTIATKDCANCRAVGHFLNEAYAEACAVLGMEVSTELKYLTSTPWVKRLQNSTAAAVGLPVGYITGVGKDGDGTVRVKHEPTQYSSVLTGTSEYIYKLK